MPMRYAYEKGDRVNWPMTSMPAKDGDRSVEIEDTIVTRYQSGLYYIKYLYKDMPERIVEDMRSNVEESFDNLITIVGAEGVGKSNLAYFLCKSYDPDFDMEKSTIYSWEQFIDSVSEDPQKVYWLDEAVLLAAGRDWMRDTNKMLVKSLQLIRSYRLTIVMCIPSFDALDVYIRTFRTRYLIKAQKMKWTNDKESVRGYAELFVPKSEGERMRLRSDAKAQDFFESKGFFRFPKMDADASKAYEDMKLHNQKAAFKEMRELTEEMKGASKYKRDKQSLTALVSYLADVEGMSYQEIADIAGMPYNTVKGMAWRTRNQTGDTNEG